VADHNPSNTTFATPDLTFTGLTGNIITTGSVTVSGCTNTGNNGTFPVTTGTATTVTVTNAAGVASDTTCVLDNWSNRVDICADVVPTFLASLPMDPAVSGTACTATYDSGYTIASSAGGRFTIAAPLKEGTAAISVTR
jgi:hypothetical protein